MPAVSYDNFSRFFDLWEPLCATSICGDGSERGFGACLLPVRCLFGADVAGSYAALSVVSSLLEELVVMTHPCRSSSSLPSLLFIIYFAVFSFAVTPVSKTYMFTDHVYGFTKAASEI